MIIHTGNGQSVIGDYSLYQSNPFSPTVASFGDSQAWIQVHVEVRQLLIYEALPIIIIVHNPLNNVSSMAVWIVHV